MISSVKLVRFTLSCSSIGEFLFPLCSHSSPACRDVDPYSVLLTPLTYEGLVDEVLHIENGRVKLDASLLGESKEVPTSLLFCLPITS
jgi:hypothetical protein